MRAAKFIVKNKNMSYEDRLKLIELPTLKYRRARGDMIEVFKIINGIYDESTVVELPRSSCNQTRGNSCKLSCSHVKYDLRKYSFANRVVGVWNSLHDDVVSAPSMNSFKNRLDKFWSSQDMLHNWRCDIAGIGSRSFKS